jgi:hypothetical protein
MQKYLSPLTACCESEMICMHITYPVIADPDSARMCVTKTWQSKIVTQKSHRGLSPDLDPDPVGFSGSTSH